MPRTITLRSERPMNLAEYSEHMKAQGEYLVTNLYHEDLEKNEVPPDTVVSRYLDFPEFLQMINGVVKFSSARKLREHDYKEFRLEKQVIDYEDPLISELTPEEVTEANRLLESKDWAKHWFISCWSEGSSENMALWKIFASSGNGIMVSSTVGRIRSSISKDLIRRLYCKKVSYTESDLRKNVNDALFCKSNEFRYESEIRLCFQVDYHYEDDYIAYHFDPATLFTSVTLGPKIHWLFNDVKQLLVQAKLNPELAHFSSYGRQTVR